MKVFISQPMNGKSKEEILSEREKIKQEVSSVYKGAEFIESYFENFPDSDNVKNKPLFYLGKSIELLADADIFVSTPAAVVSSRGCMCEADAANRYGIPVKLLYIKKG